MFKDFCKKLIAVLIKIFELFIWEKDLHKPKIIISCEVVKSLSSKIDYPCFSKVTFTILFN